MKDLRYIFFNVIVSLIVFGFIIGTLMSVEPEPDSYLTIISNSYNAGKWIETSCLVTSSKYSSETRIKSKSHGETITYNIYFPVIEFSYKVNNSDYKSSRYNFYYFLSEDEVKAIIKDYPPGKKTVCYVNPSRPEEVVLNPEKPVNIFNRIIKEEPTIYYFIIMLLAWCILGTMMGFISRKTIFRGMDLDKTSSISDLMKILSSKSNKDNL